MKLRLEDAGLPECPPVAWMDAVRALGWDGGGPVTPAPRDVALWYHVRDREFVLVVDIDPTGPSLLLIAGTPRELADWIAENRPELTVARPADAEATPNDDIYDRLVEYAEDPGKLAAWWQLCDDCDAGRVGFAVDVGDA